VDDKEVRFKFKNYDHNIIVAKENVSDFLYEKAIALLELDDKAAIREAHSDLSYIERINPNYEQNKSAYGRSP
jgi:hypothetical protein